MTETLPHSRSRPAVAVSGRTSRYFTHLSLGVWCAIACYVFLFVDQGGFQTLTWIAVALVFLIVWPGIRFSSTGEKRFLVLGFLALLQFVYFVAPFLAPKEVLETPFMAVHYNNEYGMYILLYSAAFILLFEIGFISGSSGRDGILARQIEGKLLWAISSVPSSVLISIMAADLIFLNYKWDLLIPAPLSILAHIVFLIVPFCFVAMFLRPHGKPAWIVAFGIVYPLQFVIQIGTGFLAYWLFSNAITVLGYGLLRKRVPWALAVIAIVTTIPIVPLKSTFRTEYIDNGRWLQMTRLEAGLQYLHMTFDYFSGDRPIRSSKSQEGSVISRVAMGPVLFSRVLTFHENGRAEFQEGSTFLDLPLSILPRAIFPWKSEKNSGQWFGHTYEFLPVGNLNTSVNLPPIVESYINFGDMGALLGVVLGYICGWMSRLLGNARTAASIFAIAVVFSGFANAESAISIVYGQAFQLLFVVWIGMKIIGGASARRVSPQGPRLD
jgi:hypothetical protein